jgi:hypothetical protein
LHNNFAIKDIPGVSTTPKHILSLCQPTKNLYAHDFHIISIAREWPLQWNYFQLGTILEILKTISGECSRV